MRGRRPGPGASPSGRAGSKAASQPSSQPSVAELGCIARAAHLARARAPAPRRGPAYAECEARLEQARGQRPLAFEQYSSPFSPKSVFDREPGNGNDRRPVERASERLRELRVGRGVRRGEVHRAREVALEREAVAGDDVVERRPSSTTACRFRPRPPSPSLNGVSMRFERATRAREDDSLAEVDDADARLACGLRRGLPGLADLRRGSPCRARLLGQDLVSAVAVDPGPARDEQHGGRGSSAAASRASRFVVSTRESRISALRDAVQRRSRFAPLRLIAPVHALEGAGVERAVGGIPLDLVRARERSPHEPSRPRGRPARERGRAPIRGAPTRR